MHSVQCCPWFEIPSDKLLRTVMLLVVMVLLVVLVMVVVLATTTTLMVHCVDTGLGFGWILCCWWWFCCCSQCKTATITMAISTADDTEQHLSHDTDLNDPTATTSTINAR